MLETATGRHTIQVQQYHFVNFISSTEYSWIEQIPIQSLKSHHLNIKIRT